MTRHAFGPLDHEPVNIREPLAGLELGMYDRRIIEWLAGFDIPTIGGAVSLLHRARAARPLRSTS